MKYKSSLKGKRIIMFTGLRHHLDKLKRLLVRLEDEGCEILYVTAQNGNSDVQGDFEVPLIRAGIPYKMLTSYLTEKVLLEISQKNNLLFSEINRKFNSKTTSVTMRTIPDRYLKSSFIEAVEVLVLIKTMLEKESPDACLALHEGNFWTKLLMYSCMEADIPSFTFQEGIIYSNRPSISNYLMAQYSTKVCLWGTTTRDLFLESGCEDKRLEVTGSCHMDAVIEYTPEHCLALKKQLELPIDKKIILLAPPFQADYPIDINFYQALMYMVAEDPDLFLALKWRPADVGGHITKITQLLENTRNTHGRRNCLKIFRDQSAEELISAADAVVTKTSSIGAEAVVFGKPLFEIHDKGEPVNSYAAQNVAIPIKKVEDFKLITHVLSNGLDLEMKTAVGNFISRQFHKIDGKSTDRILEVLTNVIAKQS